MLNQTATIKGSEEGCREGRTVNRYMIEVSHDPSHDECHRLAESLYHAGVHFMTRADWGCEAGIHASWLTIEALNDLDARLIVPPALRSRARIVRLNKYGTDELDERIRREPSRSGLQVALA
jgi:hypothetical protein